MSDPKRGDKKPEKSIDPQLAELQRLAQQQAQLIASRQLELSKSKQTPTQQAQQSVPEPLVQVNQPIANSSTDSQLQHPSSNIISNPVPQDVAPYFADKIESSLQRLKGNNWATWKWQLFNVLDAKGLSDILESQEARGSPREVAARQIISGSLDSQLVSKVIHCSTAQEIWSCLRGIYENRTSFALTDLIGRMNSFRMNTLEDVENGISEIQSMACQIKALGGLLARHFLC